jgi:glyoxylase-like metal-dependent hydrolase (beta-lactamase superfamily II)
VARLVALLTAVVLTPPLAARPLRTVETATHRFEEMAPGVFFSVGTGSIFVMSNAMVIVNDEDVIVVDSHVTPAAARALLVSIRELTDKPVRYLINSHYHFDHAHGNQAFPDGVEILGHEYTRERLLGPVLEESTYLSFTEPLPARLEELRSGLTPELTADARRELEERIRAQEAYLAALPEIAPTPPTLTVRDRMTLHRGERSIEMVHLGRGHTGGDLVVFLPHERIVFTGDLLLPSPSYMGDGYVEEWIATLDRLRLLDFEWILPGHGAATNDRAIIDRFQAVLRSLWQQAEAQWRAGRSVEEAVSAIDLTAAMSAYAPARGQARPAGADPRAVARIYRLLEAR